MKKIAVIAAAIAGTASVPASAAEVFFDNFNSEPTGVKSDLTNFTVNNGTVDVLGQGDFGLPCAGGSGRCLDLDGGTSAGGDPIVSKAVYNFNAGDVVTFSLDAAGSQRGSSENLYFGFGFVGAFAISNETTNFGSLFTNAQSLAASGQIASATPYGTRTISFTADAAGSFRTFFGTISNDNVGPLADNVRLDITRVTSAVPEPATWAMMIGGFGMVGGAMRSSRRKTKVSYATA